MSDDFEDRVEAQLLRAGEPRALAAPTPSPASSLSGAEKPFGAIENGRVLIDRVEQQYSFECEAGPLNNCADWHEVKRCFEFMAEFISLAPAACPVEFPYQRTFDAIGAAVTLGSRGITSVNISVKAFQDAWNAATATEGE